MKSFSATIGLALLVFASATAGLAQQEQDSQTAPKWAQDQLTTWYAAFNAGDAVGIASHYATDAVEMPPGQTPVRGRSAIEALWKSQLEETVYSCHGGYDGFHALGDLAVGWGRDSCTESPKAGGANKSSASRWLTVYERDSDAGWLITRDAWEELEQ